jgi:GNAT superfamily N-acetyltransferase
MSATPNGQRVGDHSDITFTVHGADCIDRLEPLWLCLFDHHLATGNAGFPAVSRDQTWPLRRRFYQETFDEDETAFVLLAERDGQPVGYAVCRRHEGWDDTWETGDWVGEVETLVVRPEARGAGVGTALLDAAEGELGRRGAHDIRIAVMAGNDQAMEFYRRRGMSPTITYLMRLGSGDATHRPPAG